MYWTKIMRIWTSYTVSDRLLSDMHRTKYPYDPNEVKVSILLLFNMCWTQLFSFSEWLPLCPRHCSLTLTGLFLFALDWGVVPCLPARWWARWCPYPSFGHASFCCVISLFLNPSISTGLGSKPFASIILFTPSFLSAFSLVDVLVVLVLFLMMLVDHFSALPSPAGCSFTLDWSIMCLYVFTMFDLMINYFCDLQSLIQQPFSPSLWISPLSFSPITIDSPFFYGII